MTDLYTYRVLRQMDGDKQYLAGDKRDLTETSAKHLVDLGVLAKIGPAKNKAAAPLQNKAEDLSALTNKQLQEVAAAEGIAVESDDNKATLVDKIVAGRAAKV